MRKQLLLFTAMVTILLPIVFLSVKEIFSPHVISISPKDVTIKEIQVENERYLLITGPPLSAFGSHQWISYCVGDEKIQLQHFFIKFDWSSKGSSQTDWPILISEDKLLADDVRITCLTTHGEVAIASVKRNSTNLTIRLMNNE